MVIALGLTSELENIPMETNIGHICEIPLEFIVRLPIQVQDFSALIYCPLLSLISYLAHSEYGLSKAIGDDN